MLSGLLSLECNPVPNDKSCCFHVCLLTFFHTAAPHCYWDIVVEFNPAENPLKCAVLFACLQTRKIKINRGTTADEFQMLMPMLWMLCMTRLLQSYGPDALSPYDDTGPQTSAKIGNCTCTMGM